MKFSILFFIFAIALNTAQALTTQEAFESFYNDEKISSHHCGKNIHYFLKFLKENNVDYKKGYVVSIHEDYAKLNHFNARWGSRETYQNGETYSRSNWYFHVFLVLDNIAYDFSKKGLESFNLKKYLETSYYPSHVTQSIIAQGKLDKPELQDKYLNLKMKIYNLDNYLDKMGPAIYTGSFIEIFKMSNGTPLISDVQNPTSPIQFVSKKLNKDNSASFEGLTATSDKGEYPVKADALPICRGLGFYGSNDSKTLHTVSDDEEMHQLYSHIKKDAAGEIRTSVTRVTTGYRLDRTIGAVSNQPLLHYAKEVTCSDLFTTVRNLD